jgi:hypothetical protein
MAAVCFAGLLVVVMQSDQVRGRLTVVVRTTSILGMTIERSARAGPPDAEW